MSAGLSVPDLFATATALTARSVARALVSTHTGRGEFASSHTSRRSDVRALPAPDVMIVSGGGARNPTLMRMLARELPGVLVQTLDAVGWPSDVKEALGFALLADAAVRGVPAGLPNVTGARAALVLGALAPGRPPHVWPDWIGLGQA